MQSANPALFVPAVRREEGEQVVRPKECREIKKECKDYVEEGAFGAVMEARFTLLKKASRFGEKTPPQSSATDSVNVAPQ